MPDKNYCFCLTKNTKQIYGNEISMEKKNYSTITNDT